MVVLGLVVEQPNQTVAYYAKALQERFPLSRFSKPTTYVAINQMRDAKWPLVQRTYASSDKDVGAMDRYEPTAKGRDVFREWMFRPPRALPAIREGHYGRIGLARLEDLPWLVRREQAEERIAKDLYTVATRELLERDTEGESTNSTRKTRADFEREIHEIWLYVNPMHWASRATLCQIVIEHLEAIADEAGIGLESPDWHGVDDLDDEGRRGSASSG